MSRTFPAWLVRSKDELPVTGLTHLHPEELMDGDVTVRVEYSTLNYKDALALTGRAPILRRFPMIPGVDLAGEVVESSHAGFAPGDRVLLNGFGVGESHYGGYAGMARVDGNWLLAVPQGLTTRQAMAIGTAGYTAMLALMALERHGLAPGDGPVLVTGAAGGVGSVAVAVLAKLGYAVTAATGRPEESGYLHELGAAEVIDRRQFADSPRPLRSESWAGAIDVAGGRTLANVLSEIRRGGAVAACGLADSMELPASVAPFILRGIALYGIDSVMAPLSQRREAWRRLALELDLHALERMTHEIALGDLPEAAQSLFDGRIRGRTVVRIDA